MLARLYTMVSEAYSTDITEVKLISLRLSLSTSIYSPGCPL